MKVYCYHKKYLKDNENVKMEISRAIVDLYKKIKTYEQQGIQFNKIFNDDKVKYDKQGKFFVYKHKGAKIQLRILYTYIIIDNNPKIVIVDYVVKRDTKEYLKYFERYKDYDPIKVLEESFIIN